MNKLAALYAISKQLPTAREIHTDYGDIELDDELREAINDALSKILKNRLDSMEEGDEQP